MPQQGQLGWNREDKGLVGVGSRENRMGGNGDRKYRKFF